MQKNKSHYTVIVSEEAEAMLLEYTRFLARASVPAANGLVSDFLELVASLETMPERFPAFVRGGYCLEGYYKALFAKRYLAIFCIEGQSVCLDFVVDCRKENDKPIGVIRKELSFSPEDHARDMCFVAVKPAK